MDSDDELIWVHGEAESWAFDRRFMESGWTCIWDDGCVGIQPYDNRATKQGCCSVGAEVLDEDEAMNIAALGACIEPELFHHFEAARDGVFTEGPTFQTRVLDGACIFFNPVAGDAPTGCALHHAAVADGESPMEWKPSVCWQLPLRVERLEAGDHPTYLMRPWQRSDWDPEGNEFIWWCTEIDSGEYPSAYRSETPVALRLRAEVAALAGNEAFDSLATQIGVTLAEDVGDEDINGSA